MLLLALSVAPGLAICFYIFHKDIYNREPKITLLISFILGMLAIIPAYLLESVLIPFFGNSILATAIVAYGIVGLSEELFKFLVVRYYCYSRKSFDEPLDGIIYAVVVSMGFATVENIGYVMQHGYSVAIARMFLAIPAHATFGVMMGYFIGKAKFNPSKQNSYFLQGIFWAVFFHGTYDLFLFLQGNPNINPLISDMLLFSGAVASLIIAIRMSKKQISLHQKLSQKLFKPGMMALKIQRASIEDINTIRELTFKVWPQTYAAIIEKKQIDYMLDMMYSEAALEEQMLHHQHTFIIIYDDILPVAFASYGPSGNATWKLHKIYILPDQHGKGVGRFMINHIMEYVRLKGGYSLILNVNRNNKARYFYEKLGFNIIGEEDTDIGSGYFMNDYIMEKKLQE
ncbi:MAG: GNAT family N-acetyltransferase [Chitinophagaceae bacterium]|jgi:RsiW-degrading membrane proteinase PrsW (M82 family)/GNAT superfamily N-acetyltransferase|nr:GNAT family N-acetyltransferase [Chitinophagaceae bacterium]